MGFQPQREANVRCLAESKTELLGADGMQVDVRMQQKPLPQPGPQFVWCSPRRRAGERGVLGSFPFLRLQLRAENNLGIGCHSPSPQRMMLLRCCWQPVGVRPRLEKGPASWRLPASPRRPPHSYSRALACTLKGALPGTGLLLLPADKAGSQPSRPRPGHTHTGAHHRSPGVEGTEAPGSPVPSGWRSAKPSSLGAS